MSGNKRPVIAVSGLGRGENPQPGGAVIQSIRAHIPQARFVGISYDPIESGLYSQDTDRVDAAYLFPFPGAGARDYLQRIRDVHAVEHLDLIIPTLDSEFDNLLMLEGQLKADGIALITPSAASFAARAKPNLAALGVKANVDTPRTIAANDVSTLAFGALNIGYPCYVKGASYDAQLVKTEAQLVAAFNQLSETWGFPVLVQEAVYGEEYDIVAVADAGNLIGAVAIRKLMRSHLGKGFGGIVVKDPELDRITRDLLAALKWDGPLEIELVKPAGKPFVLFEINPRFPAWTSFAAKTGMNLPAWVAARPLGLAPPTLTECAAGQMFLRHCQDIVTDIAQVADLNVDDRLVHTPQDTTSRGNKIHE